MHRIFGSPKPKVPPPSLQDATSSIGNRTAELDKKIKALDNELLGYKEQLKKAKGPAQVHIKKRALDVLKRKRMYEGQRDAMAAQAFNIDQTAFAIDTVKDTHTTVAAMKAATVTLKQENKKVNLGEIEDMQDDLEDLLLDTAEIQETLGRSYGVGDEIDESDLDAELAGLEDELDGEELSADAQPAYLRPSSLPVQPTATPKSAVGEPAVANAEASKVDEYGLPTHA